MKLFLADCLAGKDMRYVDIDEGGERTSPACERVVQTTGAVAGAPFRMGLGGNINAQEVASIYVSSSSPRRQDRAEASL
jgi:hypothetical protein